MWTSAASSSASPTSLPFVDLTASVSQAQPAAAVQPLRMVLCGPMGMGKSFICWALALMNYALGRRVLYVGDASEWMNIALQHRPRYLIHVFLSLNRDRLDSPTISALEHPSAGWDELRLVLKDAAHPTLLIIDEHSAVVPVYEGLLHHGGLNQHPWITAFIQLNIWESALNTVVLFSGSSHGTFEIAYMKNGMQEYKRFVEPMRGIEAITLMQLEGVSSPFLSDERLRQQVLLVTNCVPREISHFVKFLAVSRSEQSLPTVAAVGNVDSTSLSSSSSSSSLPSTVVSRAGRARRPSTVAVSDNPVVQQFVVWRSEQIEQEAAKYFEGLSAMQRTSYLRSLTALFARSSLPQSPGDTAGFFDLGLCYRYYGYLRLVLRPLCFAATAALLRLYHAQAPAHSALLQHLESVPMANLKGDGFEDLMWHYITGSGVAGEGQDIPCYYLNGTSAAPLRFDWCDFYTLEDDLPPPVLRDRSILYRCRPDFPRWDFLAPDMAIQVSRSTFSEHNRDSADLRRSFQDGARELLDILDSLRSGRHTYASSSHSSSSSSSSTLSCSFQRDSAPVHFHLVYVTLRKPNHPGLFKTFPDLRVIAAEEVWGRRPTATPLGGHASAH